jgi:hypothetical protein
MTSNIYIIDTSSLVQLSKHNPLDVYPGVWKQLEGIVHAGKLIAPREVFNEILKLDDGLSNWAKKHNKMFKSPTEKQIQIVRDILEKFPSFVKSESEFDADPWVIALAVELAQSPQKTLFEVKRIVVTEEKLRGNKVKIPFVCQDFKVESMDIIDMFRTEGWKF